MSKTTISPKHGLFSGEIWHKYLQPSIHMLRNPKGWAVDLDDLRKADAAGIKVVHIQDMEGGRNFYVGLKFMWDMGFPIERNHGWQWILRLEHWVDTEAKAKSQRVVVEEPEDLAPTLPGFGP